MNKFQEFSATSKDRLRKTKIKKVRDYIHGVGYLSSTLTLPEYYKASGFSKMKLEPIDYKRGSSKMPKRTQAIKLVSPKGMMSWRQFGLMHPYAYWHISKEITQYNNWRKILSVLGKNLKVSNYSIPPVYSHLKPQGAGINGWKTLTKQDLPSNLSKHTYYASSDISNFYPSIYTHSIAWAIEGKAKARVDPENILLGNHLDKLFQNSRDGQTNGILVGSIVSDIVAELILTRIDESLSKKIKLMKLDLIVVRFRDDYKFLCTSKSDAEKVLRVFSKVLQSEFDLMVNEKKTKIEDDVVLASLRPWDLEFDSSEILSKVFDPKYRDFTAKTLTSAILAGYEIQSRYPESRSGISVLNKLAKKLEYNKKFSLKALEAEQIIPLIRQFMLLREDVTPNAMLLIDQLMRFISEDKKEQIIRGILEHYTTLDDNEYQEVWLCRVCMHHCPTLVDELFGKSENPLIVALSTVQPHYKLFGSSDIFSPGDIPELEKFRIIDKKLLEKAISKPITSGAIDPFRY